MLTIRNLAALAVAVVLSAGAGSAQAAKGKKKGEHHLHGVVVAVDHDKDGGGTITIKTHHKNGGKTGPAAESEVRTVKYNQSTKFEFVHGDEHKPATAADLYKGEHVSVAEKSHLADKVEIRHHAKAKKAK